MPSVLIVFTFSTDTLKIDSTAAFTSFLVAVGEILKVTLFSSEAAVDFSGELNLMGQDMSGYPLDGPLPDLPEPENGKGRWKQLTALARRENLTIRQLFLRFNAVRGHRVAIGTPADIADQIEDWFARGAADGFNLIPPLLPSSLTEFVDLVVPELQRRGLFRTEYEATTLRGHLHLPRPQIGGAREAVPIAELALDSVA